MSSLYLLRFIRNISFCLWLAKKQILATKEVFGLVNNEAKENEIARKMNKLQKAGISTM